jgi:hypothetical protein
MPSALSRSVLSSASSNFFKEMEKDGGQKFIVRISK